MVSLINAWRRCCYIVKASFPIASSLGIIRPVTARSGDANFYDGTNVDAAEITTPNALLAGNSLGDEYITVLIKNLPYVPIPDGWGERTSLRSL